MNDDSNRSQMNTLKAELERVEMDLRFLRVKADELESRIAAQELTPSKSEILARIATPPVFSPAPEPPKLESIPTPPEPVPVAAPEPVFTQAAVQEAPPIIAEVQPPTYFTSSEPEPAPIPATPEPPIIAKEPESFEMRLGTYWFVRIGIVMVLTAMVFLGNYAYQHYIGLLGPIGKVILLYLGSATLIAAGTLLPRKQERLKNYGQVLFAGGLAGVYFTTYAAHHFANLRVISTPVLDGILLLAWTSFIVWLADRKKSEVMAVFAIGLAYYTALITNVGNFTLISNLLLAAAAVFFLVRNRWVTLTFLSVAASYGSYLYWRYYIGGAGIEEFSGRFSICGYWTIFTAAVFLTRHAEFTGPRRAGFLSFNNGAAFILLTASLYHQHSGKFWQLALAAGGILLALSYFALKFIPNDEFPRRAYLAQGLLLTTLGIITKLSGPTLALVLGVESALLLIFATQWKNQLLRVAAVIVGALSAGWLLFNIHPTDAGAWAKAAGVFALLLFDAIWVSKHEREEENPSSPLRALPTYFGALALLTWCGATFALAQPLEIAPILAVTVVALTALHYLLRTREITLLAQGALATAQVQMLALFADHAIGSTWSPVIVVVISLAMAIWWRHQKAIDVDIAAKRFFEILSALAAAGITQLYLPEAFRGEGVITASWLLTFAWTALGVFARSWPIAAAGQLFVVTASFTQATAMLLRGDLDTAHHSLELIGATLILAAVAHIFSKRRPDSPALKLIPSAYQWIAAILTLAWVQVHITEPFRFLAYAILFAASFGVTLTNRRYWFAPGIMFAVVGLFSWFTASRPESVEIQNLLAILILGAAQMIARRTNDRLPIIEAAHQGWIAIVSGALWLFVSWWVIIHSAGAHFYLTASWAILAFVIFALGFALHERIYRWAALVILASALGRVMMLDVWKLETIYRILSFLAIGIVLLVLGYFYTRFQEKIARWL